MPENEQQHTEVEYTNKPYFIQVKRVLRKVKAFPDSDKPKKLGFYLLNIRGLEGSAVTNERIVKEVFGTAQEMSPNDFLKKLRSYEVPSGKKTYVRHETAYQQTQRLIPGREREERGQGTSPSRSALVLKQPWKFGESGGKKPKSEPLNRTIQVSIFGEIYDEILKKYKSHPQGDNIIRAINRNLAGHFDNAAAFVRWTEMTPAWIHVDAFQTDFFNKVKAMRFNAEQKEDEVSKEVSNDFRKYEDEFFKAAMSYVVRTHSGTKIYTANTEDLVAAVEHVRGDVKLKEYYYKLPKLLGFRLISLDDLQKKLHLGPEKNAFEKKFHPAVQKIGKETEDIGSIDNAITEVTRLIKEAKLPISKEQVDEAIRQADIDERIASAFHQFLDELTEVANGRVKKTLSTGTERKTSVSTFLKSKKTFIKDFLSKSTGPGKNIWFGTKQMLFEETKYNNRLLKEHILDFTRLVRL